MIELDENECQYLDLEMEKFIAERITQLRMAKNISESQMSEDLGLSRNYINGISLGKRLPKMRPFLCICKYFDITPSEFFDTDTQSPDLVRQALNVLKMLDTQDIEEIIRLANRFIELKS